MMHGKMRHGFIRNDLGWMKIKGDRAEESERETRFRNFSVTPAHRFVYIFCDSHRATPHARSQRPDSYGATCTVALHPPPLPRPQPVPLRSGWSSPFFLAFGEIHDTRGNGGGGYIQRNGRL